MNEATNNETSNIATFMKPRYMEHNDKPVTVEELLLVQPMIAKEWDTIDEDCGDQYDYFLTCLSNVRNEAKRKANTHKTKFYITTVSPESRKRERSYNERFINTKNGIELEFNFCGENESMNIRIPQNRLEEMHNVSQTNSN